MSCNAQLGKEGKEMLLKLYEVIAFLLLYTKVVHCQCLWFKEANKPNEVPLWYRRIHFVWIKKWSTVLSLNTVRQRGNNVIIILFVYRITMFNMFVCLKFYFWSSFFPVHPCLLLNLFALIPVVMSWILQFRGPPLFLLPGGQHYKVFLGSISSFIICIGQ